MRQEWTESRRANLKAFCDTVFPSLAAEHDTYGFWGGVKMLESLTLMLCYALPDAQGTNPNWPAIGYPGPLSGPKPIPKRIRPFAIDRDGVTLEADVCIVGSGAGGGSWPGSSRGVAFGWSSSKRA